MFTHYNGLPIIKTNLIQKVPKLKLTAGDYCSDEMRNEMDAYLLDTFGEHYPTYVVSGCIVMNPETYHQLRIEAARNSLCN